MSDRGAETSADGLFRFRLWRRFDTERSVGFIMLNPSTADADQDDPTIRACLRFARRFRYGGIEVVNLFAYRATDPAALFHAWRAGTVISGGDRNDVAIAELSRRCRDIILAWGSRTERPLGKQRARVLEIVEGNSLFCLGRTKTGAPRHPLYLSGSTRLEPWARH